MIIDADSEDAIYIEKIIYTQKNPESKTLVPKANGKITTKEIFSMDGLKINVDFNEDGRVVGVEIL